MTNELREALAIAKRRESENNGCAYYVVWSVACGEFIIVESVPYFGEWYSSDGIQHGARVL